MMLLVDLLYVAMRVWMNCNVKRIILSVKWLKIGLVLMTSAKFSH